MSKLKYKNEDYTVKIPNDRVYGKSTSYPAFRFTVKEIDKNNLKGEDLICLISTTSVFDKSLLRTYKHIAFYNELTKFFDMDTNKYNNPHYFFILESQEDSRKIISDIEDKIIADRNSYLP